MIALRPIVAIARADFLERIRRYSFLVTLLFAVFLGYCAATGKIYIRLDDYRGVYTSGWIGTMMAMVTTCFVSLIGFYIVKNAIDRDRVTRVGQILASTPLAKPAYLVGKFCSNFFVLGSMVAVLALSAVAMQILASEDPQFHLFALLSPFAFLALPALALVAALALFFETVPVLRGGFGNVVWFFLWSLGIGLPEITKWKWLDPIGLLTVGNHIMAEARKAIPGYKNSFSFTIDLQPVQIAESLRYGGMDWTANALFLRLLWIAVALIIVLLAAIWFNRFDEARSSGASRTSRRQVRNELTATPALSENARPVVHLTPLNDRVLTGAFGRLVVAELRLMLQGLRWWWYVVAVGLVLGQLFAPLAISTGPLLATAWVWPMLTWSAMGARESRFGTEALLFSSPRILFRQLPACLVAGVIVTALSGAGAGIRLALAGDRVRFFTWIAAVLFIPALALALGIVTGTSKFFEALYIAWWYVGPLNRTPGLDFTGFAKSALGLRCALIYLLISIVLLGVAFVSRRRQLLHSV
jgi:hypothetical protein